MLFGTVIQVVGSLASLCQQPPAVEAQSWVFDVAVVQSVAPSFQKQGLAALDGGAYRSVDRETATSLTSDPALADGPFYYLVRAGVVAGPDPWNLNSVRFDVAVDARGVGYVGSFRLTHSTSVAEVATIVVSRVPLADIVVTCGAAE